MVEFKKLTTTLPVGINTHTFTDSLINVNSVIEVYFNTDDVYVENITQSGNSVTVEASEHSDVVELCITINNVETYEPVDVTGITQRVEAAEEDIDLLEDDITTLNQAITDVDNKIGNLNQLTTSNKTNSVWAINEVNTNTRTNESQINSHTTLISRLRTDLTALDQVVDNKQNKLTAGNNITIINDVISSTGGSGSSTEYGTTAEFEAEKDSFPVGTEFLVTDDYDESGNNNIYSPAEVLIGSFLGKNLYRKVFRTTENVTNSNKEFNQTDASAIKDIVNIHFVVEHTSHSWCISAQGTVQNNHIYAKGESNDTPTSGMYTNIVVEYTKVGE